MTFLESGPHTPITTGTPTGRSVDGWWESVVTSPGVPVTLDALDEVLDAGGYARISGWRQKVTASGAVRFFADAAARIEDATP